MTKKLLLTIALGAAITIVAASTALSQLPGQELLNDTDGDGVPDTLDACPTVAGLLDLDGCPAAPDGGDVGGDVGGLLPGGGGSTGGGGTTGGGTTTETGTTGTGTTGTGTTGTGTTATGPAGASQGAVTTTAKPGTAPAGAGKGKRRRPKGTGGTGREKMKKPPIRKPNGVPTNANPSLTIAQFGAAPIGVPNFIINSVEIPPFLFPLYQACGTQYGIPWPVLASINRIETDFGRNLNVSSAGAMGWMQFIPSSWRAYGVDANEDGVKNPYSPPDAICAAARYLKAAGGQSDLRRAIFAYNHATWYVDEVLLYANQYAKLPETLVGSITGLTEGAHFPVAAKARYADDISEREAAKRAQTSRSAPGNAADVISDSPTRRGINIYSKVNAPVVAVNDGVIKKMGQNAKLGKFIVLQDAYGNRFTYAQLGSISPVHPVPKERALTKQDFKLVEPKPDPKPSEPASDGTNRSSGPPTDTASNGGGGGNAGGKASDGASGGKGGKDAGKASGPATTDQAKASSGRSAPARSSGPMNTEELRARLFALPQRPSNAEAASLGGQLDSLMGQRVPAYEEFKNYFSGVFRFDRQTMELRQLKVGSQVTGGTLLGKIGQTTEQAPHLHFSIRPAGKGAPKIDPKVILDGWKLLEATAIYRAAGKNPFDSDATVGQILLMSKATLMQRVLNNTRLQIYSCGRQDVQTGQIDRRSLAMMEYLTARGYHLTITSLKCGHSFYTTSGNVSAHSSGNAVDIAQVNGLPILGNQGPGSITEAVLRDLMLLQGTMRPAQLISLMDLGPPTFVMSDHADHIHVGYTPPAGAGTASQQAAQILEPKQWQLLIERLGEIENPDVPVKPMEGSLPSGKKAPDRSSDAHVGD
jgi:murein DD-endopeptidase MepM/ murein hydrolase activator NlpD